MMKNQDYCILHLYSKDSVELRKSRSVPSLGNDTFRTLHSTFLKKERDYSKFFSR